MWCHDKLSADQWKRHFWMTLSMCYLCLGLGHKGYELLKLLCVWCRGFVRTAAHVIRPGGVPGTQSPAGTQQGTVVSSPGRHGPLWRTWWTNFLRVKFSVINTLGGVHGGIFVGCWENCACFFKIDLSMQSRFDANLVHVVMAGTRNEFCTS